MTLSAYTLAASVLVALPATASGLLLLVVSRHPEASHLAGVRTGHTLSGLDAWRRANRAAALLLLAGAALAAIATLVGGPLLGISVVVASHALAPCAATRAARAWLAAGGEPVEDEAVTPVEPLGRRARALAVSLLAVSLAAVVLAVWFRGPSSSSALPLSLLAGDACQAWMLLVAPEAYVLPGEDRPRHGAGLAVMALLSAVTVFVSAAVVLAG